jgi:neutral ceramidase
MKLGTAWEDITPSKPVPLFGQMNVRLGQFTRDPLTVNAVVFDDGVQRVAVVSVDVCVLPDVLALSLRNGCAAATGLYVNSIHIAATHTHVAPCTTNDLVGKVDSDFLKRLDEAVTEAVRRAMADLEDVELFAGRGHLDEMGWNRRGMRRDGSCEMYWGSWHEDFVGLEGPRDGEVGVLFARNANGRVKAVIPSFSTHPNCVEGESFYSADLPGEVRRVLRDALGERVGVVYLTAAAGNTAPSIMEDNPRNEQPWRGEAGLVRSGKYLGGEILKVIAAQTQPMVAPVLRPESVTLEIPMRAWDSQRDPAVLGDWMREYFEKSRADWPRLLREDNPVKVSLSVLRVGDAAICFNPAELYCEFGLAIKKASPARVTLIAELTDGWSGYVPTPEAICHGGYSAMSVSHTRLVPEAGGMMVEMTSQLLQETFAQEIPDRRK